MLKFLAQGLMMTAALACLPMTTQSEPVRDGSHDFDFARGVWHTHVTKILDPFDGSTHTMNMEGTKTAKPFWDGRAVLEEIEADGPEGHWEGASLFIYNHTSGQWSQTYIDSDSGNIEAPEIGGFKNGRGELFSTTQYQGRNVLVRGVWSDITPNSHRYEISLSRDGGRTWVTSFKAYLTRAN
jgi:hypothetical protein